MAPDRARIIDERGRPPVGGRSDVDGSAGVALWRRDVPLPFISSG